MIEAYCSHRSYSSGDRVDVHVSTDALRYTCRVVRQTSGQTEVFERTDLQGIDHAVPADAVENGCGWPVAFSVPILPIWKSGFYKIILTTEAGETGESFFVLRAAKPTARLLWVIETNTWNAYNYFGGASTYTRDGDSYEGGAARVSFLRPLPRGFLTLPPAAPRLATVGIVDRSVPYVEWAAKNGVTVWSGAAGWAQWDAAFAAWLEAEGVDVDFACSSDLEDHPDLLDEYEGLICVGHDEYWSWEMRDTVEAFIARGGNAAFLTGNTSYWQVRLEADGQQMVAYKAAVDDDPVMGTPDARRNTGSWSHRITARPENMMSGLSFARGGYARMAGATPASAGGFTIYRHRHWALEGTGISYGDQLGAAASLVGYECDGCVLQFSHGLPFPTGEDGTPANFEIIGIAPATLWSRETAPPGLYPDHVPCDLEVACLQMTGKMDAETLEQFSHGHAVMGSYESPGGGLVFSSGTTDWAFALGDPQVARITRNILARIADSRREGQGE